MGYLFLLLTIFAETGAVLSMKASSGFTHRGWSVTAAIAYLLSFIFLTLALKHLPAGIANAIWAGSSTLLVAIVSFIVFGESLSLLQISCLILISVGIIGLSLTSGSSTS